MKLNISRAMQINFKKTRFLAIPVAACRGIEDCTSSNTLHINTATFFIKHLNGIQFIAKKILDNLNIMRGRRLPLHWEEEVEEEVEREEEEEKEVEE